MHGSWESADSLVLPPNQQQQQQQQQQQSMMEDNHPLHSPTPPAWGITDRIVKEEPNSDRNNDSGVSPGNYTSGSSGSGGSSPPINISLSPGSIASGDSPPMQTNGYGYSPPSDFQAYASSLGFPRLPGMEDLPGPSTLHQPVDGRSPSAESDESEDEEEEGLKCSVCPFVPQNRRQLREHLTAHCTISDSTNFNQSLYAQASSQSHFSEASSQPHFSQASPQPHFSQASPQPHFSQASPQPHFSQASPQAHFSQASPQAHFSQASPQPHFSQSSPQAHFSQASPSASGQMSPMNDSNHASPPSGSGHSDHDGDDMEEPGVRTPRVNSQGKVKTFRCKQCSFVAVTKLSFWEHSRKHIKAEKLLTCPRCPFVTEFKHHLEYHLRNHFKSKPFKCNKCTYSCVNKSMLNSHMKSHSNVYQYRCADCTYATKYCHSLKLHLRKYNHQAAMVLNADGTPNPLPIIDVYGTRRGPKRRAVAPKPKPARVSTPQSSPIMPNLGVLAPLSMTNGFNPMMALNHFSTIFSGLPVVNGFGGADAERMDGASSNIFVRYAQAMVADRLNANLPGLGGVPSQNGGNGDADYGGQGDTAEGVESNTFGAPLDLSKPETSVSNNNSGVVQAQGERMETSPRTSGKSRRKGRAVKLNRQVVQREDEGEASNGAYGTQDVREEKQAAEKKPNVGGSSSEFTCQYCEIAFGNEVMYTVHMGYHGYSNPFTCNMCGHQCDDKVSFFLHIARVKHA